jgi:SAM-dependent methyltransferase
LSQRIRVRPVDSPAVIDDSPPEPTAPDASAVGMTDAMLSGWFRNELNEVFTGVPISAADVVIDVGCGDGGNLNFCANRGAHVIAVDIDGTALADAKRRLSGSPARVLEFHEATAEAIPVESGTATRVICTEVLEHVDDPAVVLAELKRVAAPGALFLITVPDALQERMQTHVAPDVYFAKPNHIRIIERDEFRDLVSGAGLEVVAHETYGFFWSIWFALFWSTGVDLTDTHHPVLDGWTTTWQNVLATEKGRLLKRQLDDFMPKSQVIVARKLA